MERSQDPIPLRNKVGGLLSRPSRMMAAITPNLGKGALTVVLLIVTAGTRAGLQCAYTTASARCWLAIPGAAIGIIPAWVGMTAVFHFIARALGGTGSYRNLLALMGYAATPMILTSLVSVAIYIISPLLLPKLGGAQWGSLHTLIGWIGMSLGWPGLLSFYALRHGEGLSSGKAGGIVATASGVMLVGWSLPVLVRSWFE